jgi:hypothetical protein
MSGGAKDLGEGAGQFLLYFTGSFFFKCKVSLLRCKVGE